MDSWNEQENVLVKTFRFKDFKAALAFINAVATIAESMQHHPDISLKNYNQVVISTTTHDAGNTVSAKDYELASAIDRLVLPETFS